MNDFDRMTNNYDRVTLTLSKIGEFIATEREARMSVNGVVQARHWGVEPRDGGFGDVRKCGPYLPGGSDRAEGTVVSVNQTDSDRQKIKQVIALVDSVTIGRTNGQRVYDLRDADVNKMIQDISRLAGRRYDDRLASDILA